MAGRLDGKVALITGGASGIGRGAADRFVEEGAKVFLTDLNAELLAEAEQDLGDAVAVATGDVREEAAVEGWVAACVERFGRLDAAVNCAGVGAFGAVTDLSVDDWDTVVDICLKGVFLSVKHEARAIAAGGGGAIVNVASLNARQPAEGMSAYCAAKAGVEMFTKVAAMELGPQGIRVTAVAPGLVDTPLTQFQRDIPALREEYVENTPMKRVGTTKDVADAALFLVSDEATWVSGDLLLVDGAAHTGRYPRVSAHAEALAEVSAAMTDV